MKKRWIAMLGMAVLGLALAAGCSQAEPDGPMEKTGAAMDDAADRMEDAADDVGDAMEDAADAVGDAAEEAGDAVQKATGTN